MLLDCLAMLRRPVAFVPIEPKVWMLLVCPPHHPIPCDFGDDACCGYRNRQAVATNNCAAGDSGINRVAAINQQGVGRGRKVLHRLAHCQEGGTKDVDAINFAVAHNSNPPGHGLLDDQIVQPLPLRFRNQFGVANAFWHAPNRKHHCGSNHRAGQRAAPCFINPSNGGAGVLLAQLLFKKIGGGSGCHDCDDNVATSRKKFAEG